MELLIGMLLVAAVLRSRGAERLLASQEMTEIPEPPVESRSGIHLVTRRPAARHRVPEVAEYTPGLLASGVVFLMRQFAVRVLRAEWRPRQTPATPFTPKTAVDWRRASKVRDLVELSTAAQFTE